MNMNWNPAEVFVACVGGLAALGALAAPEATGRALVGDDAKGRSAVAAVGDATHHEDRDDDAVPLGGLSCNNQRNESECRENEAKQAEEVKLCDDAHNKDGSSHDDCRGRENEIFKRCMSECTSVL